MFSKIVSNRKLALVKSDSICFTNGRTSPIEKGLSSILNQFLWNHKAQMSMPKSSKPLRIALDLRILGSELNCEKTK